jgi:hypothetical protein
MIVAGVDVPASAVAELALRLHQAGELDLAQHVGRAVDNNRAALGLDPRDVPVALSALEDCPDALVQLRGALLHQHAAR